MRTLSTPEQRLANAGPGSFPSAPGLGRRCHSGGPVRNQRLRLSLVRWSQNKFTRVPQASGTKEAEKTQAPGGLMELAGGGGEGNGVQGWGPLGPKRWKEDLRAPKLKTETKLWDLCQGLEEKEIKKWEASYTEGRKPMCSEMPGPPISGDNSPILFPGDTMGGKNGKQWDREKQCVFLFFGVCFFFFFWGGEIEQRSIFLEKLKLLFKKALFHCSSSQNQTILAFASQRKEWKYNLLYPISPGPWMSSMFHHWLC